MPATFDGETVRAGERSRERFFDSRGYGRPANGELVLAPVEAAHLLYRGDLDTIVDESGDQLGFLDFLRKGAVSEVDFLVYKDLRERGFYLSPAAERKKFVVYPRGKGPWDDTVAYHIHPTSERGDITVSHLQALARADPSGVLAVVDEESELTYLTVDRPSPSGTNEDIVPDTVHGSLLADRVLVEDPPARLHDPAFYGQPLGSNLLQLSLVEAAYLAGRDVLAIGDGRAAILERGRTVEGERFDRRLEVYGMLRSAGIVPKTGFKFGADFRTYADVESIENLGHSEALVRVRPPERPFSPRALALDVRLAGGVRKRTWYAVVGDSGHPEWLEVSRLTP
ncbi:MAG: tRNA-intron lyase [Salinirussus sp.]